MLLPFIDQAPLYSAINFDLMYSEAPNLALSQKKIAAFLCPSEQKWPGAEAGNNYVVSAGPSTYWGVALADKVGMFRYQMSINMSAIQDGTSNTIATSESTTGSNAATFDLKRVLVRNVPFPGGMPNSFATQDQLDSYGQTCRTTGAAGGGAIHNHVRREWMNGIGGQTVFNTLNVPNTPNPDCHPCAGCGWYDSAGVWSARSQHTGGAHVLMADGAVRFASDKASGRNCRTANRSLTRKRRIRCGASFACASGFSGEAFSCRSPYESAEADYRTALKLVGGHAPAAYNLARLLLTRQKPAEALELYRQCNAVLEQRQPALVGMANCLRLLNRNAEARQQLEAAVTSSGPLVEETYRLLGETREAAPAKAAAEFGQLELSEQNYPEAVRWLQQAVQANPRDWKVRFNYATALQRADQVSQAAVEFDKMQTTKVAMAKIDKLFDDLKTKPNDPGIRYEIGCIFLDHISEKQGIVWLNGALYFDSQFQPVHRRLADYFAEKAAADPRYADLAERHRRQLKPAPTDTNP